VVTISYQVMCEQPVGECINMIKAQTILSHCWNS